MAVPQRLVGTQFDAIRYPAYPLKRYQAGVGNWSQRTVEPVLKVAARSGV